MADRVGIIRKGQILMVDEKAAMMERLGRTEAFITLAAPLAQVPSGIAELPVTLSQDGRTLVYRGGGGEGASAGTAEVAELTKALTRAGIDYTGIDIHESSLEDIFVNLLEGPDAVSEVPA